MAFFNGIIHGVVMVSFLTGGAYLADKFHDGADAIGGYPHSRMKQERAKRWVCFHLSYPGTIQLK